MNEKVIKERMWYRNQHPKIPQKPFLISFPVLIIPLPICWPTLAEPAAT
jgi:hypothetical protein